MSNINFQWWKPETPHQSISGTYKQAVTTSYGTQVYVVKTVSGNMGFQGSMADNEMKSVQPEELIQVTFDGWAKGKADKPYRVIRVQRGMQTIVWTDTVKQYRTPKFCDKNGQEIILHPANLPL